MIWGWWSRLRRRPPRRPTEAASGGYQAGFGPPSIRHQLTLGIARRRRAWQLYQHLRALAWDGAHLDLAAQHIGDDAVHDVHAQARSAGAQLGGEEGIED